MDIEIVNADMNIMNKIKKISLLVCLLITNLVFAQDKTNAKLIEFKERNAKRLTYWQLDSLRDRGAYIENFMDCIRVDTIDVATDSLRWSEYLIEVEIINNDECPEFDSIDYKFYKIKVKSFLQYFTNEFTPPKKIKRIEYLMLPKNLKLKKRKSYYILVESYGSPKYLNYISRVSPRSIFIDTRTLTNGTNFNNPDKNIDKNFKEYKKCIKRKRCNRINSSD